MSGSRVAWLAVLLVACGRQGDTDSPGDTDEVSATGPFVVPRGADSNGDNYIDRLFLDRFTVDVEAGSSLEVTADNGPDQGDVAIFVFEGDDVVASGSHDVACTYPAITDPDTGCPSVAYTASASASLLVGLGVWVSHEELAAYSFVEFSVDGVAVEPSLVDDDMGFSP